MIDSRLEPLLARVFGVGMTVASLLLALGLFWRPALWAAIAVLAVIPPTGAALAWRVSPSDTRYSILLASLGVLLAITIGLLLRK